MLVLFAPLVLKILELCSCCKWHKHSSLLLLLVVRNLHLLDAFEGRWGLIQNGM